MRPLGENQQIILRSLLDNSGYWHVGCGWYWDTYSGTTRLMESLLKRGLVTKTLQFGFQVRYDLTEAGRTAAA